MKPLIGYGNETDDEIVKRHMHRELQTWISHLEAINKDAEQLAEIILHKIGDKSLRNTVLDEINENINLINDFYTYKNHLDNVRECDEMDCDHFYMNQHDQVYEKYVECVAQYRVVRNEVYQKLLV